MRGKNVNFLTLNFGQIDSTSDNELLDTAERYCNFGLQFKTLFITFNNPQSNDNLMVRSKNFLMAKSIFNNLGYIGL